MKTNLNVVAIKETCFWNEDFIKQNNIKKIESVYLLDKNQVVNCCELTPSYWLEFLYYIVDSENEEATERVDSETGEYGTYYHCSDIDKMECEDVSFLDFEYKSQEEYMDKISEAIEYCNCNHQL